MLYYGRMSNIVLEEHKSITAVAGERFPPRLFGESPQLYWSRVLEKFISEAFCKYQESGDLDRLKGDLDRISHIFGEIIGDKETREGLDGLTSLPNKKTTEMLIAQIVEFGNQSQIPYCVIIFDIDEFKQYNDAHGQRAGDLMLQQVVNVHRTIFNSLQIARGVFGRYGGEEFLIAFPLGTIDVRDLVEKFRSQVETDTEVTCSYGVYIYRPESGEAVRPEMVLERANVAMAVAKGKHKRGLVRILNGGWKNRVVVWKKTMPSKVDELFK